MIGVDRGLDIDFLSVGPGIAREQDDDGKQQRAGDQRGGNKSNSWRYSRHV